MSKHYSLQTKPGEYDAILFDGLDWVVQQVGSRGMRIILVFTDYWEHHGGVSQYLEWAGSSSTTKNAFYTSISCKRMYKDNARALINRFNPYTQLHYRDDPTIMAWELINEPRCRNCAGPLQSWLEEMARFVKKLDRNHLLSTGEEGFYSLATVGSRTANPEFWAYTTGQDFVENHAIPEIDFAVAHLWPDNWGLLGLPGSPAYSFSMKWIRSHVEDACWILGKPFILEEFGTTGQASQQSTHKLSIASFFRKVYSQIEWASSSGLPAQGSMFWTWHHLDLKSVAERVDDYAVFWGDPAFLAVEEHVEALLGHPSTALPSEQCIDGRKS